MLRRMMCALLVACAGASYGAPVRTEHVEAELVAARTAIEAGQPILVALRLKMIPHWHTYWRNPGDSGQPTAIRWQLPDGYQAGPIRWPHPRRLPAAHLMNFGYEDEVMLPVEIAVPAGASGSATMRAQANWLVCNEEHCIPEEAELALMLPVGPGEPSVWAKTLERTRSTLPVKAEALGDWQFRAASGPSHVELSLIPPAGVAATSFTYFPFDEGKIHNAGAQPFERDGKGFTLRIPKAQEPVGAFTRVSGLLVADRALGDGTSRAVEIDVPITRAAPVAVASALAVAMLFAFAGGLILNLMPCVLPVLSIKVLGFAGGAGDRGAMRLHGTLYALGVVASFLGFAAVLLVLKAGGAEIGWGFQLQSPAFVALLAILFLALALNLSGAYEFGSLVPARIAAARSGHARTDAFLTGVLAVAIASPCTAPFMGAALGYALGASALEALAVFAALGIGMALPYFTLAWHPQWMRWVPKPGAWMVRFKQVLAVPLYATVVWLGWVFAIQTGVLPDAAAAHARSGWEPYSEARLAALAKEGKPAFVDFTAAWCVTCQVNKQLVLGRPEVERDLRSRGVTLLRADWTRRDAEITRALAALGRNGVPVYAFYLPGREPQLLPEVLTREAILAVLERN
jgi:thiol:disulfide interchange protein DsbD